MKEKLYKYQQVLSGFAASMITLIRVCLLSRKNQIPTRLKNQTGDECVILMNGPSLNRSLEDQIEFIKSKEIFCANYFAASDMYQELKPSHYLLVAPELWHPDVDEIFIKKSEEIFSIIGERTRWPMHFYIPFEARKHDKWKRYLGSNDNILINYINVTPVEGLRSIRHFLYDNRLGMPRPHNILIPTLMIGIQLDFKTIYVFGADHSWLPDITVNEENQVLIRQKHFYDDGSAQFKPMNYKGRRNRKLHEVLHKFVLAFSGYHDINTYAESKGIEILNATPGSYIDAFKRINFEKSTTENEP